MADTCVEQLFVDVELEDFLSQRSAVEPLVLSPDPTEQTFSPCTVTLPGGH
jgi:hypothetical protein